MGIRSVGPVGLALPPTTRRSRPVTERMESMAELTGTLIAHRKRLGEVAAILARNGLAAWIPRGSGLLDAGAFQKLRG